MSIAPLTAPSRAASLHGMSDTNTPKRVIARVIIDAIGSAICGALFGAIIYWIRGESGFAIRAAIRSWRDYGRTDK